MAISLDGIASGLDTAELIASLMDIERIPQTLLQNRVTATETKITDFQSLNAKLASLATLATTTSGSDSLQKFSAKSNTSALTVSAGMGAAPGSLDVTVTQLAQAQTSVLAPLTEWPSTPPVLTIVGADGTATEITAASSSLSDVVTAINSSAAGIVATRVAAGINGEGVPQYRLQLVSAQSGVDGAFSVYSGTADEVAAKTAPDLLSASGAATVRSAQDATITLWAGTPAEQVITSSSNTFTDILPGVTVTASALTTDPATVTVTRDAAAATAVMSSLVDSLSTTLGLIDAKTATTQTTDATGKEVTGLGSFTSDSLIRSIRANLVSAITDSVDGHSAAEIGLSVDKKGSVTFDSDRFAAALKENPALVESIVAAVSTRVAAASTSASSSTGSLTAKITGAESSVSSLTEQVERWDTRLENREAILARTYAALEVSMGKLNSQQAYLTSQLDALAASKND
ncbi:MAG TPA: flagellar filament capping protein FliD [Glaciihabitans sp.]|nr:flagellar filament capping protein FliD [Glaciihabitans sp.]